MVKEVKYYGLTNQSFPRSGSRFPHPDSASPSPSGPAAPAGRRSGGASEEISLNYVPTCGEDSARSIPSSFLERRRVQVQRIAKIFQTRRFCIFTALFCASKSGHSRLIILFWSRMRSLCAKIPHRSAGLLAASFLSTKLAIICQRSLVAQTGLEPAASGL